MVARQRTLAARSTAPADGARAAARRTVGLGVVLLEARVGLGGGGGGGERGEGDEQEAEERHRDDGHFSQLVSHRRGAVTTSIVVVRCLARRRGRDVVVGWQIRWLDAHAPYAAPGPRSLTGCAHLPSGCRGFCRAAPRALGCLRIRRATPVFDAERLQRDPNMWPGARHPPPRSIVALWKAPGDIAVTAGGALYAPRSRRLYQQHPEYHAPPPCAPTAATLAAAPQYRRAVALTQAYGANHWHLLAELLPRALTVRPLLAADAGAALLLPPGATAAARELLVLLGADPASIHPMTTELVVAGALAFPTYAPFSWHTERARRADPRAARRAPRGAAAAAAASVRGRRAPRVARGARRRQLGRCGARAAGGRPLRRRRARARPARRRAGRALPHAARARRALTAQILRT